MWELQIAGEDIYHIMNWFYIYSFLGWLWESSYVSVKKHKLVNRGFVTGPVCTIYGFGAVSVYLILKPISDNILLLYIGGVLVPTILEYFTAVWMEHLFHTSWWDYSGNKFNLQGRICLGASLGWGVFSVVLFYLFQPFVNWIVSLYSVAAGELLVRAATLVYAVDFGMSYMSAMQIGQKLRNMDAVLDELYEYIQNTKLYESTEELKGRLAQYSPSEYMPELKKRIEGRIDAMVAFKDEAPEEFKVRQERRLSEMAERFAAAQRRFEQLRSLENVLMKRTMNAYPNMKSRAQALKERAANKKINKPE